MVVDTLEFLQSSKIREFLKYSPNPYNMKLACIPSGGYPPWCYDTQKINYFFNASQVKLWLGKGYIHQQIKWEFANFLVASSLMTNNPPIWPLESYYSEALRHHLKVIIVYGKLDSKRFK